MKWTRKASTLLAAALSVALFATGCGTSQTTTTEPTTGGDKPAVTYTVKHAMGEQTIQGQPQRVVVLTNEGTEALLALGVKPVGAVKSWLGSPWYDHIKGEIGDVKVVGDENQPNLEAIAALKPDLIIGNKLRQEKIYEQLKAIAPTVYSETLKGEWQNNFKFYATALNRTAEGDKAMGDYNKRVADLKAKAGDTLKTKISVVRFLAGKTRIYFKESFSGLILQDLGFARADAQNKPGFAEEITKERMPEMEGDLLFYFTYETGDGKANQSEQEWTKDALFQNLQVAKSGKVIKVSDAIWNTAGGIKAAHLMLDDIEKYLIKK